jgi:hypothetical protein
VPGQDQHGTQQEDDKPLFHQFAGLHARE